MAPAHAASPRVVDDDVKIKQKLKKPQSLPGLYARGVNFTRQGYSIATRTERGDRQTNIEHRHTNKLIIELRKKITR